KDYIYEKLNRLINKRIQSIKKGSIYIIKQKIKNEYIQLGYDETCIIDILDKQIIENNIEKEYFSILKKLEKKYTGNELEYQVKQRLYQKGYKTIEIEKITKKSRI
ncbi:MAG TPA: hypothetical protein GX747_00295, partial [Tenericutes bacterium]|nr:hypothetical protein [Mycoplasmatota bacterium]